MIETIYVATNIFIIITASMLLVACWSDALEREDIGFGVLGSAILVAFVYAITRINLYGLEKLQEILK